MNNDKHFHVVKIELKLYEQIKKQGKYGETFSDILKRLLNS